MRKVGIIGLGHVGSTIAHSIVLKGLVDELVLIDLDESLSVSEQYDLLDAQVNMDTMVNVKIQDYQELNDADILIVAAGEIALLKDEHDRFKELSRTKGIAEIIAENVKRSGFTGVIIVITNPCDIITTYLQHLLNYPKDRIFGTGTMLDTARFRQTISQFLGINSHDVHGYVFGEHGATQVCAWSTVQIGGKKATDWIRESKFASLEQTTIDNAWKVFSGKWYTNYGIAACAVKLIQTIYANGHQIIPVSIFDHKAQVYYGRPALIGRQGVIGQIPICLTNEENQKLAHSVDVIQKMFHTIK